MPYRDDAFRCPECSTELHRYEARDKWRCKTCVGALTSLAELAVEVGDSGVEVIRNGTASATATARPCPRCTEPMQVFALGTLTLDWCVADGLVWFDRGELGRLRAAFTTPDDEWAEKLRAAMTYAL